MGIPPLDELGLLPAGVWDCSFEDISTQFCWNDHRRALWKGFLHFIEKEYRPASLSVPLWIDGSFVRSKPIPSDIDVVMDFTGFDTAEDLGQLLGLRVRHDELKTAYHVDLWSRHPLIPNDLGAFFQYAGDKCAAELNIDIKHPKGILRVRP